MNRYDGGRSSQGSEDRRVAFSYIGNSAANNLQAALPNNWVEIVGSQYNKDNNRLNLKLKVHGQDLQSNSVSSRVEDLSS